MFSQEWLWHVPIENSPARQNMQKHPAEKLVFCKHNTAQNIQNSPTKFISWFEMAQVLAINECHCKVPGTSANDWMIYLVQSTHFLSLLSQNWHWNHISLQHIKTHGWWQFSCKVGAYQLTSGFNYSSECYDLIIKRSLGFSIHLFPHSAGRMCVRSNNMQQNVHMDSFLCRPFLLSCS